MGRSVVLPEPRLWGVMRRGCHYFVEELTVCALEMLAIAQANGPMDAFQKLNRIDRKLGMEAGLTYVPVLFVVSNIDILHIDEHFSVSLEICVVYGGSRMIGFFCARIIQLL
jgi:hypothetical protein